ncbi:MAG: hypothetical protein RLZZ234_88 [Candidatus Parcubacteria bacterium]|jgi:hypothetical protein
MISQDLIEKINTGNITSADAQEFQRALGTEIGSLRETNPTEYLALIKEMKHMVAKTNELITLSGLEFK